MKTLIQKIYIEEDQSFACRTYTTPHFETSWHKHEECELIVITQGHGTALIGDFVGEYKVGDIFFLATQLPHWFRKHHPKLNGSATVIHFKKELWGSTFLMLPELKNIYQLLNSKQNCIQLQRRLQKEVSLLIQQIDEAKSIEKLNLLLLCLQKMATSNSFITITQDFTTTTDIRENSVIEKIFDYSFKYYLQQITLHEVATIAGMTIPTFCRFFKKNIKKTYFEFLQEIRISHACKLLNNSNKSILEICYESGYNSWAHFSKQFKHVKGVTPSLFRKQFA